MCATTLPDFRDFMVRGSAPLQMLKKSIMSVRGLAEVLAPPGCEPVEPHSNVMGEALWREKEILALALDYLKENLPELPTEMTSDAWLGVGVK